MRACLCFVMFVVACGAGPRSSRDVRERLRSADSAAAREHAPDLIAQVETAIEDADNAESAGDEDAAADHATRARLLLDAALAEAVRVSDEADRSRAQERTSALLARARRDERASEEITAELARLASARTAREEAARALAQAELDEAQPRRRTRVSMEEGGDLVRAAAALRARARVLASAAQALGATEEALRPANDALAAADAAPRDPLALIQTADRAHHAALRALGQARRAAEGPGEDGAAVLAEAARAEGFEPLAVQEGLAVEVDRVLSATGVARTAENLIRRIAALIAAHPHGPVQILVPARDSGARGEQTAQRRADALRTALISAGADASRLTARPFPAALGAPDRARLVFVAYGP
jgi:hypothetical protein